MIIKFITSNKNKFQEIVNLIPEHTFVQVDMDLLEIQGTSEEIITAKVIEAHNNGVEAPFIVEDTSLVFNAFNSLPGPYIKYFCKYIGSKGLYNILSKYSDKTAIAYCYIGYYDGTDVHVIKGSVSGTITKPTTETTFAWDNIFVPDGYNKVFSELGEEKNSISHRKKCVDDFKKIIDK